MESVTKTISKMGERVSSAVQWRRADLGERTQRSRDRPHSLSPRERPKSARARVRLQRSTTTARAKTSAAAARHNRSTAVAKARRPAGGKRAAASVAAAAAAGGGWTPPPDESLYRLPLFMAEEHFQRLMRHAPPYGFRYPDFKEETLRSMRRNATLPPRKSFGSCAVVGSSGTLREHTFGAEIDAHDAVFRVNTAPVGGKWSGIAGARTTWRFVASPHAASGFQFHEQAYYPNTSMVAVCDRGFVYSCQNVLYATRKPLFHGLNPIFYAAVRRHVDARKRGIPLTGLVAVAAAMRSCDSVDVYGMSTMTKPGACIYWWRCGRGGRMTDGFYHSGRPGDAEFHDFQRNAGALVRWNASGSITLRTV